MSSVSCAVRRCFHSGMTEIVRMLCSLSASLMMSTRQSFAMATSILRTVAACWASLESNWSRSSFVTPSTIAPTSGPNCSATWDSVILVSSTASCSSAEATDRASRPRSATIVATATGWVMKGSPVSRTWPSWATVAACPARVMSFRSEAAEVGRRAS